MCRGFAKAFKGENEDVLMKSDSIKERLIDLFVCIVKCQIGCFDIQSVMLWIWFSVFNTTSVLSSCKDFLCFVSLPHVSLGFENVLQC